MNAKNRQYWRQKMIQPARSLSYWCLMDTLCPWQKIKCDWLELEWMKMKSISKNLFFFLQTYSQQQCPQHTILSFSAEFNFTAALLSMPLETPQEDLVWHYYHRLWLWTWTADWRRSCRAPCSADNCASHPRWPWQTLPQQILLGYHDSDPGTCLPQYVGIKRW